MSNNRNIGILFTLNDTKYVTLLDNKSRRNFKRLAKDWAGATDLNDPEKGETFEYLPLTHILNDIESTYRGFEKTPATEKLARDVFRLVDQIKIQNNIEFTPYEEDSDDNAI